MAIVMLVGYLWVPTTSEWRWAHSILRTEAQVASALGSSRWSPRACTSSNRAHHVAAIILCFASLLNPFWCRMTADCPLALPPVRRAGLGCSVSRKVPRGAPGQLHSRNNLAVSHVHML